MDGDMKIEDGESLLRAAKFVKNEVAGRAWYRGQAKANWGLVPKVHEREGGPDYDEQQLTNEFRLRATSRYAQCPEHDDVTGWLTLMRHYGLPTRLLDWTESILVAAFFCVKDPDYTDDEGEIWAIDPVFLNYGFTKEAKLQQINSPIPKFLAHRAFNPAFTPQNGYTAEDCSAAEGKVLAVLAAEIDPRMLVQQATFTIHGADSESLDKYDSIRTKIRKFIVPKKAKVRIAEDLKCLGIRRSNLFPDLAELARELEGDPPDENPVRS